MTNFKDRYESIEVLEKMLNKEEIRQAKLDAVEECSVNAAVKNGMDYITQLTHMYESKLQQMYNDKYRKDSTE